MAFNNLNIDGRPGGSINGSGSDTVGEFTIEGGFNTQKPVCRFTKQYIGMHAIYY